jgi:hypothetical protein
LYYEALLFSQEGGLQQILLLHEEGDTYANQISERVLNSVELKQATNNGKITFEPRVFFGCFFDSSCNCMVDAKKNHQSATLKISSLQGFKGTNSI